MPLALERRALGLIVADNAFSHAPIGDGQVQLLQILALLAASRPRRRACLPPGRAADEAPHRGDGEAARDQDQLLHSERLATVGAVVARVSHEIRNPLTTIGGFARALGSRPENAERVKRNADIIVQEVEKLEVLLKEMLDFTSPRPPSFMQADANRMIASLAAVHDEDLASAADHLATAN